MATPRYPRTRFPLVIFDAVHKVSSEQLEHLVREFALQFFEFDRFPTTFLAIFAVSVGELLCRDPSPARFTTVL